MRGVVDEACVGLPVPISPNMRITRDTYHQRDSSVGQQDLAQEEAGDLRSRAKSPWMCAKSFSRFQLSEIPWNLPGFSVRGILQARVLEWVAISSSRGSSGPRDRTHVFYDSCIGR